MKRPTMLVEALLRQAALDLDLSVERDIRTIGCRCKHEGFEFLTITLPVLSDALERGLEAGSFSCPTNFGRHGRLPRFLGGFFKRVFASDGRLLPDSCPETVYWIRQICRFFKKPKIACKPLRNLKALKHFLEVEGELRRMTSQIERKDLLLDKIGGIIWSQVFPEIDYLDLVCHHGPGVTADRYLSNERNRISKWNTRSELTYPSDLHCYPNYGIAAGISNAGAGIESADGVEYLNMRDELPVEVVFVPKTLTTPRVIAIEPSHVQYMQQSVKDYVYKVIETHRLTKYSIRFLDQGPNQRLAYSSSIDKRLATLDLKDASDRVHLHLVQRIFKTSGLLEYLEDARSLHATLPNEQNIVLTKYASMGSALCFPVEAMVFYTLVQSAMHQLDGRRPSSRSIRDYSRSIDIYGDDIIVPVEYTDVVVRYLESYALKVNVNKSFRYSNFRESCGADYYKGFPVNPVYARTVPHDDSQHWGAEEIVSWNATADLFYLRGKWVIADAIRKLLRRVVKRTIPKTRKLGSGLAHFSFLFTTDLRFDRNLQCWKQKRLHYDPVKRKDSIDGYEIASLNKWGQSVHAARSNYRHSDGSYTTEHRYGDGSVVRETVRNLERINQLAITCGTGESRLGSGCSIDHSRTGCEDAEYSASKRNIGVRGVPDLYGEQGRTFSPLQPMVGTCDSDCLCDVCITPRNRREVDYSADYCLTEPVISDPLSYLEDRSVGLNFLTSTKRGSFKSKCRWVSLAG
ncbi:RNA-directed RNA polymerase [ssRNA phage Gerhypos.4_63]|uniref:RNA-directed RNA polymerase n=2 Tax=Leviviricetes TaxID=2842243 RepID=A0A8S5L2A1_9VIRU|nr:RNA-directed RNA polymerase [ssRNA phage Gerhypos.4_63]QDH88504.1 MAG: RNA-dependent RNA polymerase [Leviviridae sp.]DAD51619.1 TPA_asm: RNA-directed RNA polymerase [ssRNA phage Gerhypos.4_63]